jgi:hypothetical protein
MFDKATRRWSEAAIAKVAQERDYYPPDVEARITSEVEAPGHIALGVVRNSGLPGPAERDALVYYVALMLMRGPRKRRRGWEVFPDTLDQTLSEIRAELRGLRTVQNSESADSALRMIDQLDEKYRGEAPPEVIEAIKSPWPSDNIVQAVRSMAWRFVRVPGGHFLITSDTPAFFFESIGLGPEAAELTWPISPSLALLGSRQGEPSSSRLLGAKPPLVREINRRLAVGAERFIFSPRKATWIEAIALRMPTALHRINWLD